MFNLFRKKQEKSHAEDARAQAIKGVMAQFERGEGVPLEAALALHLVEDNKESLTRFLIQFGEADLWLLNKGDERMTDPAVTEGGDGMPYIAVFSSRTRAESAAGEWQMQNRAEAVSALELVFALNATSGIVLNSNDPHFQWAFNPQQVANLRTIFEQTYKYELGGIYTVWSQGGYRAVKVLAVDTGGIHIRLYANRWTERPASIDPAELTMNSEKDGSRAVGHMPVVRKSFLGMGPRSVGNAPVDDSELEGYAMWAEAKGGYFGTS